MPVAFISVKGHLLGKDGDSFDLDENAEGQLGDLNTGPSRLVVSEVGRVDSIDL